jgi:DNA-binding transcriptional regulator YiaG
MPNIASVFKTEIARVARKEVRGETLALKAAVTLYRKEIAALKRRTRDLEIELRRVAKGRSQPATAGGDAVSGARRFSAKGLASLRRRLGLSAAQCGQLLGASAQSVYNWEQGKARPSARHLPVIATLRGLGKREVAARLASQQG